MFFNGSQPGKGEVDQQPEGSTEPSPDSEPGWKPDPTQPGGYWYWDGTRYVSYTVVQPASPVQSQATDLIMQSPMAPVLPKSKTTAVLLAVFLGFWTWLYTYKNDSWKFWVNLPLTILTIGVWGVVAWIWAIIDVAIRPEDWYRAYPNGDLLKQRSQGQPASAQLPAPPSHFQA